ncbi:hypothetical protein FWF93_01045 [Candidatus Saccharibacteria bacterium]|nr:hypothetical protein [Candidatus Saccharibacteria bacterium]
MDFSAFARKDIRVEQFDSEELYNAGIIRQKKGILQIITGFIKGQKHGAIWVTAAIAIAAIAAIGVVMPFISISISILISFPAVIFLLLYLLGWVEEASQRMQLKWLEFAKQNGFKYHIGSTGDNNPNALAFNIGHGGTTSHMLGLDDRLCVAEYTYKTEVGGETVWHHFNFARFKLHNDVPHLVLDSKFSALQIEGTKEIRLEGNFHEYFSLYAPEGFHIDALQVFTPDVMARLLDQEKKYDIELVGSDLYIYDMRQGLIESELTVGALANNTKDRERHSQFINFLRSAIEIASEIDEQTNRYVAASKEQ